MKPWIAETIWLLGGIAWFAIRLPHQRRARKVPVARSVGGRRDQWLLASSLTGLAIIPAIYLATGEPRLADYRFNPAQAWIGVALLAGAVWLFHETHRRLGRN